MRRAVEDVLEEIGAGESPRAARPQQGRPARRAGPHELRLRHPEARARLSADRRGPGASSASASSASCASLLCPVELLLPYADGGSLAELHELAGELEREDTPEGVRVRALVPARVAARFARFAVA